MNFNVNKPDCTKWNKMSVIEISDETEGFEELQ